ncbi:MAG: phosphoglycerate mutase [Luteimonas sp.]
MASVTFLLPPQAQLAGRLSPPLAVMLGRSDVIPATDSGERSQLLRYFDLQPHGWPVAALTRQSDVGDAAQSAWLRADPAWIRPDINGARLFACGEALHLTQEDVDALLPALQALFADAGFVIDAPEPSRWYVRVPQEVKLPEFAEPADALGADLFEYLPRQDDTGRWSTLLSEAQVVLHNHPWNARRMAVGKPPVNSLWFWGGGVLPDHVNAKINAVETSDSLLRALAMTSSTKMTALPAAWSASQCDTLVDLRAMRDLEMLMKDWLLPATNALRRRFVQQVQLDFSDGSRYRLARHHNWRFFRKPLERFRNPKTLMQASEPN